MYRRFKRTALYFAIALTSLVVGYLLPRQGTVGVWEFDYNPERKQVVKAVFDTWASKNLEIMRALGEPRSRTFINVWIQEFPLGRIFYSVSSDRVWILRGPPTGEKTFRDIKRPGSLLNHSRDENLNETLYRELLSNVASRDHPAYDRLIKQSGILQGGIATVYLREDLLEALGEPSQDQMLFHDFLLVSWPDLEVLVFGNRHRVAIDRAEPKSVYVLKAKGIYELTTEFPGNIEPDRTLAEKTLNAVLKHPIKLIVGMVLLSWALLSARFAASFSHIPILRFPLELDIYVRKQRSQLIRIYLRGLQNSIDQHFKRNEVHWVSLPCNIRDGDDTTLDEWLQALPQKLGGQGDYKVLIRGRGGSGKTILAYTACLHLIDKGWIPILLRGFDYANEQTLRKWVNRVMSRASVSVPEGLFFRLPKIIYVIDQGSEVSSQFQKNFATLVRRQLETSEVERKLFLAGRFDNEATVGGVDLTSLPWDAIVSPGELSDEHIKQVAMAFWSTAETSRQIAALPAQIRSFMRRPTAFVVTHYIRSKIQSVRPISSTDELFAEILDRHIENANFGMPAGAVKFILEELVARNFGASGTRGLPNIQTTSRHILHIYEETELKGQYGEDVLPPPSDLAERLVRSGLLDQVGSKYLFFHDSFEDWLVEGRKSITEQSSELSSSSDRLIISNC